MNKKDKIKKLVYTVADKLDIMDKEIRNELVDRLDNMSLDEAIDYILISLSNKINEGLLTEEEVLSIIDLVLDISNDKYQDIQSLIDRLHYLKDMNMEYTEMSLEENHTLILEAFDKFNQLLGEGFDAFYTGGLMGYIATNQPLERYHSDLDLFINEDELIELYDFVEESDDFTFISNMDHKAEIGHEFKINYKDTPISIGLFLFNRESNGEVVLKSYYHVDEDLLVNEKHLNKEYVEDMFPDEIREHNGIPYKMQSLESIYNTKKKGRRKDKYDASIIEDYIDKDLEEKIDKESKKVYEINRSKANNSIVRDLEDELNDKENFFRK